MADKDKCRPGRADPNARYHDMVEVDRIYDRIEGMKQTFACVDCGLTIETKDKNAMVTGG